MSDLGCIVLWNGKWWEVFWGIGPWSRHHTSYFLFLSYRYTPPWPRGPPGHQMNMNYINTSSHLPSHPHQSKPAHFLDSKPPVHGFEPAHMQQASASRGRRPVNPPYNKPLPKPPVKPTPLYPSHGKKSNQWPSHLQRHYSDESLTGKQLHLIVKHLE